jgi:hypothetical protein
VSKMGKGKGAWVWLVRESFCANLAWFMDRDLCFDGSVAVAQGDPFDDLFVFVEMDFLD